MEASEKEVPMSLAGRLAGVFVSPGDVFERLRGNPSWFGALAVCWAFALVFALVFGIFGG